MTTLKRVAAQYYEIASEMVSSNPGAAAACAAGIIAAGAVAAGVSMHRR